MANQKGGVGKTTTSVNLSASLSLAGSKVLLIDLDPQGNASTGVGVDMSTAEHSVRDWLMQEAELRDILKPTAAAFDVAPCDQELTAAEVELLSVSRREMRLHECVAAANAVGAYEYIILDCPPALNILTLNALVAADGVLIPMQCEYYALEGLSALLDTVEQVRRRANPRLALEGLLRTMYDPRNALTIEVSRQLMAHFGGKVFRTVIPRNIRLAEAPSHGLPAILYDRHSKGAIAYMALAAELAKAVAPSTGSWGKRQLADQGAG